MYDDGILSVCELRDVAEPGNMPDERLVLVQTAFFGFRTVGYGRFYAALGANQQVDLLVRTPEPLPSVRVGMYAILEDGLQYRIDNVQRVTDDDGLPVTDLSLYRLEELFDVAE